MIFSWTVLICSIKIHLWPKLFSQEYHLKYLIFSWTVLECLTKSPFLPKLLLQDSHLHALMLSWSVFKCCSNIHFWPKLLSQKRHLKALKFSWNVFKCLSKTLDLVKFALYILVSRVHMTFYLLTKAYTVPGNLGTYDKLNQIWHLENTHETF